MRLWWFDRPERLALRRALFDACQQCAECKATGLIALAGAWMTCPRCGSWRALLGIPPTIRAREREKTA